MPSRKQQRKSQRRQRRSVRGGAGAAEYGLITYGSASQQVAGANGSIAMKQTCGGQKQQRRGGKSVLLDVAVPAVLLYANNTIYKNKTSKRSSKSRRSRRYRR